MLQFLGALHIGFWRVFLFQLPNPLLQELPLWFLLGQGQSFLIRGPSPSGPAEPAVHVCTGWMREVIICNSPCSNNASICFRPAAGPSHSAIATARLSDLVPSFHSARLEIAHARRTICSGVRWWRSSEFRVSIFWRSTTRLRSSRANLPISDWPQTYLVSNRNRIRIFPETRIRLKAQWLRYGPSCVQEWRPQGREWRLSKWKS